MFAFCLVTGGCVYVDERPAASPSPQKVARYMPPADQYVKSKLIDFDSPYDTSFIIADGVKLVDDPQKSGNRVMSASQATIKLSALIRGREFPGMWDLIGVRVRADRPAAVTVEIATAAGAVLATSNGPCTSQWTIHWIELGQLPTSMPAEQELTLVVTSHDGTPIQIDDIQLAQSRTIVAQSIVPESNQTWRVGRSGLKWRVTADERELFTLPAAPFVAGGYRVIESNPVRTVFSSPTRTIAIDRNGRLIENGVAKTDTNVSKFAKTTAENNSPAVIEVDADEGHVDRTLAGDSDNDGYDEARGCYTVRSGSTRLNVRLTPARSPVRWPVVEIIGLPAGAVSVWLEGQLVPYVTRLSDGKTIIELPVVLERSVEAQIRVK
jgi:hypothetical protein